jgi:tryptophan-rich sensory protein
MKSLAAKIIVSCIVITGLGLLSGLMTTPEIQGWYATLNKPSWNPPNRLFGPVWTTLYIMMGIAFSLIWHSSHPNRKQAMKLFAVQFVLNLAWTFIFFNQHQLQLALIEIIALWIMILVNIIVFYRINRAAGFLLVPYLAWVSFATFLNYTIMQLNQQG